MFEKDAVLRSLFKF